jgi:spermidine synthase
MAEQRRLVPVLLLTSGLGGAATMVVELAAVRLLAPWFGTSLVVWTNVIAVVLVALSLGYLIGGRLAQGPSTLAWLQRALLAAGALVAWAPWGAALLAKSLLPGEVALENAVSLVGWGSLAVGGSVFLPPAVLLGMLCPLALELISRTRSVVAGRAGGIVLSVSTFGSLLGVFSTSYVLLPNLGLKNTFLFAAALLFLAGVAVQLLPGARSRASTLVFFISLGGAAWLGSPPRPELRLGQRELDYAESAYQSLRVVEDRQNSTTLRYLQINEGFDSFQSVWQEAPGLLPSGFYYNDFLLPACWTTPDPPWKILVLGFGAGTVARIWLAEPKFRSQFIGVELDPRVIEMGIRNFELETVATTLLSGIDARVALRVVTEPQDQVVLDCYANQVEIPAHLCTQEFFLELKDKLVEGGWLTANLGGFHFDDPVVSAVASTCSTVFGPVLLVSVPFSRNYMLVARRDAPIPWEDQRLKAPSRQAALRLGPRSLDAMARKVEPGARVLSDDRCPIESLQAESIRRAGAFRGEVTSLDVGS